MRDRQFTKIEVREVEKYFVAYHVLEGHIDNEYYEAYYVYGKILETNWMTAPPPALGLLDIPVHKWDEYAIGFKPNTLKDKTARLFRDGQLFGVDSIQERES